MTAILPASFRASFASSTVLSLVLFLGAILDAWNFTDVTLSALSIAIISSVFGLLAVVVITTIVGTMLSALYITLIGVPMAILMRDRISSKLGQIVAIVAAIIAALLAFWLMNGSATLDLFAKDGWVFVVAIGYAIPAGIFFRRDIIFARQISPYSED